MRGGGEGKGEEGREEGEEGQEEGEGRKLGKQGREGERKILRARSARRSEKRGGRRGVGVRGEEGEAYPPPPPCPPLIYVRVMRIIKWKNFHPYTVGETNLAIVTNDNSCNLGSKLLCPSEHREQLIEGLGDLESFRACWTRFLCVMYCCFKIGLPLKWGYMHNLKP